MKRWQLRLATVLVPIAAFALFATPAEAAAVDYAALGDSYASGTGAPPYSNLLCTRSFASYPQLWVNAHPVSSFAFAACGGATTSDVLNNQLSVLNANTDLVTLQIGGNDVNFANTVLACGPLSSTTGCLNAINDGLNLARTTLPGKLDATYAAVHSRAPNARVVVLGYAHLVEPNGTCLNAQKRQALNNAADVLASIIAGRVAAAGPSFRFIDATNQFLGHGACGPSPWINSLSLLNGVTAAHPNATGNRLGYLALLDQVTG